MPIEGQTWRGLIPMPTIDETQDALARLLDRVEFILEGEKRGETHLMQPASPQELVFLATEIAQVLVWAEKMRDYVVRLGSEAEENE